MALTYVYGTILGDDASPQASVTIKATLNAQDPVLGTNDGVNYGIILSKTSTTTTDSSGNWGIYLIPNINISDPKNTTYSFEFDMPSLVPTLEPYYAYANTVQAHGASFSHTVVVPSATGVEFSTLI